MDYIEIEIVTRIEIEVVVGISTMYLYLRNFYVYLISWSWGSDLTRYCKIMYSVLNNTSTSNFQINAKSTSQYSQQLISTQLLRSNRYQSSLRPAQNSTAYPLPNPRLPFPLVYKYWQKYSSKWWIYVFQPDHVEFPIYPNRTDFIEVRSEEEVDSIQVYSVLGIAWMFLAGVLWMKGAGGGWRWREMV